MKRISYCSIGLFSPREAKYVSLYIWTPLHKWLFILLTFCSSSVLAHRGVGSVSHHGDDFAADSPTPVTTAGHLVISEVYGGGGNAGAAYNRDFVELYNPTTSFVSLSNLVLMYGSSSGTTWIVVMLQGGIPPGHYFLIGLSGGTTGEGMDLPSVDFSWPSLNIAQASGKVVLSEFVGSPSGSCPPAFNVIDFVGYGLANCAETAAAPQPPVSTSAGRIDPRIDTDNNSVDFRVAVPNPKSGGPIAQTISFDPIPRHTYGDPAVELVASASSGLPIIFTSNDNTVAEVEGNILHIVGAGKTGITATQPGNADYSPAEPVSFTLLVDKADLTITADDKSRPVGMPNPPLTVSFSGFVGSDDETDLDRLATAVTTANESSPPGTYAITFDLPAKTKDGNYSFHYVAGTLTVTGDLPDVYVSIPADGAVNVDLSTYITANPLAGATAYTIQLSETPDFADIALERSGAARTFAFSGLKYGTTYYTRVITDLSPMPGPVKSFTTRPPESLSYVYAPASGTQHVNIDLNVTANLVPGASSYMIQLSESPTFDVVAFENASTSRVMGFSGLKYETTYYNRVFTNLSSNPGPVQSFTTLSAASLAFVYAPGNNANNVNTSLNITANFVPEASAYTIQLSESSDFSSIAFQKTSGNRTISFDGLKYNTRYYNRVFTDLSPSPGPVFSFTTKSAESISYVYAPGDGITGVNTSLEITANLVPGAFSYAIQLSEFPDFRVIHFQVASSSRTISFGGLKYNTRYYNRVITNLSTSPGPVRSFTTRTAESLAYVYAPGNGVMNANLSLNITANLVPGASSYTIQLSETPDFSTIAFENTSSSRSISFEGLNGNTLYYNRVRTNLSPNWGTVRSFRTRNAESFLMSKEGGSSSARLSGNADWQRAGADFAEEIAVDFYPNPFKGTLSVYIATIHQGEAAVKLVDMRGLEVYTSQERTNTTFQINAPISNGIYLLNIRVGPVSRMIRVVRQD